MQYEQFSPKQRHVLNWWFGQSPDYCKNAIICDGAVRSGKTVCMSLSFLLWALFAHGRGSFALCGKTITSLRRNLVTPLLEEAAKQGISCTLKLSQNIIEVELGRRKIRIYLFGGKDEGSAALIQGMTLNGVLFDEVALMPRSFVEQALARCSTEKARFWFNCNPEHPSHWFYTEWILRSAEKNALYLHFTMQDNPSLSDAVKARYESLYTGVFRERFILGKWVAAHGAVYPMFSLRTHVVSDIPDCSRYFISCDYGTVNPASFGLWGEHNSKWYRIREYYHSSRTTGVQKTDEEYADALEALAGMLAIEGVLVDPSAASFLQCLRRRGHFRVIPAKNDVADGIRLVGSALGENKLFFHESCKDTIREFSLYRWNLEAQKDCPIKENDHAMDDIRYFALHLFGGTTESGFCAFAAERT